MANLSTILKRDTAGRVATDGIADGAVTTAKLASSLGYLPPGAVMAYAKNATPPGGWLQCNGAAVSRVTYSALFAIIGTTYGAGDGSTTFALPDLRGYFVRGAGTNSDGTASGTFAVKQLDEVGPHNHPYSAFRAGSGTYAYTYASNISTYYMGTYSNNTSNSTGTETRPNNIAMLYCIKF